jgi:hypothetical protein
VIETHRKAYAASCAASAEVMRLAELADSKSGNRAKKRLQERCRADEAAFEIGQADIIAPLIGADPRHMRASIIRAMDQQSAHAPLSRISPSVIFCGLGAFVVASGAWLEPVFTDR